jgi:uncharacterized protein
MESVISEIGKGLWNSVLMLWTVGWALVLGFALSAIVQAWVPRRRIERSLGGTGARPVALATALGAVSSSCSYAAIAIARSLFEQGASAASALSFQFASTNLVFELGIVIWVLLGWQFTLAEAVGGLVLIVVMRILLRVFVSRRVERDAREHAVRAGAHDAHGHDAHGHHGHDHGGHGAPERRRLTSADAWSEVAANFRHDVGMLWKEITAGLLLAGFACLIPHGVWDTLFVHNSGSPLLRTVENVLVGPLVAVLSSVCSVGNVPLAAVLWSGGISFAGVIAFLFADLLVLPILVAYRKFYGGAYTARITALMFVTIVIAALIVEAAFGAAGLIPHLRPAPASILGSIRFGPTLVANVLALAAFAALMTLSRRRPAGGESQVEYRREHEGVRGFTA